MTLSTAKRVPVTAIDWEKVVTRRKAGLVASATANGVAFSDHEIRQLIAMTIELDVEAAQRQVETPTLPTPQPTEQRRVTTTFLGVAESQLPGRQFLLLHRGDEAWLVPNQPDGWDHREPWRGNINSVRWIGGPPAIEAFRSVGAPK